MKTLTFSGGVHPPASKKATKDKSIRRQAKLPERIIIPLQQHVGAPCSALVAPGEYVREGQKIGEAEAFISAPIHASVSGEVEAIKPELTSLGEETLSVTIKPDGKTEPARPKRDFRNLKREEIVSFIKESGLVGLGGAAFPTHVKLSPPPGKKLDTYLLNGTECEPYLTCDYRLMVEKSEEVFEGFRLLMKAAGIKKGYIGIEENKPQAIYAMEKAIGSDSQIELKILKVKYPQGGEKQLIKAIMNREVPSGGLPFDVGVLVSNVGTAFSCWEAMVLGKPLIERVITVTGSGIRNPDNILVRLGTPVADLLGECGGLKGQPGKVIMGGPMMGLAQFNTEVPVVKGTSGLLIQAVGEVVDAESLPCIRCGKCLEVCPVGLNPTTIASLAENGCFEEAKRYGLLDCMECGACAYRCPAKIPLVQWFKYAKAELAAVKK